MDDLMVQADLPRDPQRELAMMVRVAGAIGGDAECGVAEDARGGPREVGAINAAAERYEDRIEGAE